MREHKCEGLKKIWINDSYILIYEEFNGQSAAKIVSDNNTVQRLDKVRSYPRYDQKYPRMPVLDLKN